MSTTAEYTNIMVCTDCYFAHHYGVVEHEGKFYAGESDTPADCKPLGLCEGAELTDNTDENGEGYDEFSMRACQGCGSRLGGSRYRLAYWG